MVQRSASLPEQGFGVFNWGRECYVEPCASAGGRGMGRGFLTEGTEWKANKTGAGQGRRANDESGGGGIFRSEVVREGQTPSLWQQLGLRPFRMPFLFRSKGEYCHADVGLVFIHRLAQAIQVVNNLFQRIMSRNIFVIRGDFKLLLPFVGYTFTKTHQ